MIRQMFVGLEGVSIHTKHNKHQSRGKGKQDKDKQEIKMTYLRKGDKVLV